MHDRQQGTPTRARQRTQCQRHGRAKGEEDRRRGKRTLNAALSDEESRSRSLSSMRRRQEKFKRAMHQEPREKISREVVLPETITIQDLASRMAERAGSDEIRGFATLLVQSTKLGSSIAQTLRTYASEMRERRRMRAEEKAHRLPVLLSIPLVAFMLPTMIGVMMLPAFIRVVRVLVPALAGQAAQ